MGHINIEKAERANFIMKIWQLFKYQTGTTNCSNCDYSKDSWVGESGRGECGFLSKLKFPILRSGICKHHSSFKNGIDGSEMDVLNDLG